jgi:putative endonuclease
VPFVYILRCGDGSFYTGIAKNLAARIRQHESGRGARYTRAHLPVSLAWSRRLRSWKQAMREEHRIKQLRRRDKEALIVQRAARENARGGV